ncbi:hypothetical protein L6452_30901 [Arctium lappa]|uniref:Uncharacterized protein n=1 Tax=Arctium lappa TaxID=4217 RepID=A0ACB8ZJC4_ARCLA|nr:hypothetical protein L6452_30901 [Arctium lappa]
MDSIGVRPESIGERPKLCSGVGPEGECGLRLEGSDDELSDCVVDSPGSGEEAIDIDDEEVGDGTPESLTLPEESMARVEPKPVEERPAEDLLATMMADSREALLLSSSKRYSSRRRRPDGLYTNVEG